MRFRFLLMFASIAFLLAAMVPSPGVSQDARLSFRFEPDPPGNDICLGDTVRSFLWLDAGETSIRAFTAFLTFEPGVAVTDSILPGSILTSNGDLFFLSVLRQGPVVDTLKIDGGTTGEAYGPGDLAIIDWIGIAEGLCPLSFVRWDVCTEQGDSCLSLDVDAVSDTLNVGAPTYGKQTSLGKMKALFRRQ